MMCKLVCSDIALHRCSSFCIPKQRKVLVFEALKLQPLEKRRLRNDLILTQEDNLIASFNWENPQKRSLACRVVNFWNRLPLSVASVTEQRKFKKTIRLICLRIIFSLYSIFVPIWSFWALCPFPISRYIHTLPVTVFIVHRFKWIISEAF